MRWLLPFALVFFAFAGRADDGTAPADPLVHRLFRRVEKLRVEVAALSQTLKEKP